jgi:hypothetical protein
MDPHRSVIIRGLGGDIEAPLIDLSISTGFTDYVSVEAVVLDTIPSGTDLLIGLQDMLTMGFGIIRETGSLTDTSPTTPPTQFPPPSTILTTHATFCSVTEGIGGGVSGGHSTTGHPARTTAGHVTTGPSTTVASATTTGITSDSSATATSSVTTISTSELDSESTASISAPGTGTMNNQQPRYLIDKLTDLHMTAHQGHKALELACRSHGWDAPDLELLCNDITGSCLLCTSKHVDPALSIVDEGLGGGQDEELIVDNIEAGDVTDSLQPTQVPYPLQHTGHYQDKYISKYLVKWKGNNNNSVPSVAPIPILLPNNDTGGKGGV